ncbi:MAG: FAD binding domain-containing protein [Alphaproteobacteria bacterium]|jgi:CO/xanthine dehydrogenase FAD-binding subunit|nr:FAD binding domain-containing protein [Alphaproteobacteria bacterium]
MAEYLRPGTLESALEVLAAAPWSVLAGGTDFYPARVYQVPDDDVLDISALADLRVIEEHADHWRLGALTTWSDIIGADLPPLFDGLKLAAREVGGGQVQNRGTLGGNLCNASPAADGVPPLLSLGASVELTSAQGRQNLALGEFILGARKTALRADQPLTAVIVPKPGQARAAGHFRKLGARKYMVISIAMAAANVEIGEDGNVAAARLAVGACSEVACRLPALEEALVGRPCGAALGEFVAPAHLAPLAPLDDLRGSAAYHRDAALTLIRRTLSELGARA